VTIKKQRQWIRWLSAWIFLEGIGIIGGASRVHQAVASIPSLSSPTPQFITPGQITNSESIAQVPSLDRPEPPSRQPLADPLPTLPAPDTLLQPSLPPVPAPERVPSDGEATIFIREFNIVGNTVLDPEELRTITDPYTNRDLTFADLVEVRSQITQRYIERGYINSGAYLPPQTPEDGVVTIQVVEGQVSDIVITGNRRLRDSYVRDRLALATEPPFNLNELVEALQLLQLDPRIETISAELAAGVEPGTSVLQVQVAEADPFQAQLFTNNGRSPAVGSWRRGIQLDHLNVLGFGDTASLSYANTDGSNAIDARYAIPINPRNGTLDVSYGIAWSEVIEEPFSVLDIQSESRYYELTYRQPLVQTPTEEFALSLTASRRESESEFLEDLLGDPIPFPALGADEDGETRLSILRFSQEWTQRSNREVLALRSQFSFGLDAFDATLNEQGPDGRFFSWRGQGQWVRLLGPETLVLLRGDIQLADNSLVPLEQFGLGGPLSVRGYRQDQLLTDNGVLLTAEARLPIVRSPSLDGILHIIPFVDLGTAWNADAPNPDPSTLLGLGLGLQWQMADTLTARLDWGIPLIDVNQEGNTWQDNGVYFSIVYSPF